MKVAIGLPTAIAGTSAACLLDWAQRAEEAGFSSLAVLDRIAYRNHDPVPVLAAAAAVTRGIGLLSAVLLGPVRGNGAILAKQLADIDDLSGGRLTIGIAAGARADDFALTGTDFEKRGRQHDLLLDQLASTWRGGPPLLIGGSGPASIRRVTRSGAGWICGSGGPDSSPRARHRSGPRGRRAAARGGRDSPPSATSRWARTRPGWPGTSSATTTDSAATPASQ